MGPHPLLVRICHWINAAATLVMIGSGWAIYNAAPLYDVVFPAAVTLGGWLGGALLWHFAGLWLLLGNGLVYLGYGVASGRLRRRFWPLSGRDLLRDLRAAVRGRLSHHDPHHYNMVQKLAYLGAIGLLILLVLSGFSLWKPVQMQSLAALFGGYDTARYVHFWAMAGLVAFLVLHAVMSLLVPQTLIAMLWGGSAQIPAPTPVKEPSP